MHVIVLGAGVVGAATALALAERGIEVSLVDARERVADDTSHANGGGLTPLHSEPWNGPDLLPVLLKNIGRKDAPWRLPPGRLPGLGRWGLAFLANAQKKRFVDNARANIRLGLYSLAQLRRWRNQYDLQYAQTTVGSMQVYTDGRAFERALSLRRELIDGLGEVQPLAVDELVVREPALVPVAERLAGGLYYPEHESGDAAALASEAAKMAEQQGAHLHLGERVSAVMVEKRRFVGLETSRGRIQGDACVLAAGPETPHLLRPLGLKVPIEPVRGYSATFELDDGRGLPRLPLLDTARRFVTLRLGETRLRVAGLADFAGHRRAIPPARMDVLLDNARSLLPAVAEQLTPAAGRSWAGLRPLTPDGRPLLGESGIDGLYLNAGHGSMGWTMACGSAQLIASLIVGNAPELDLSPYHPAR